MALQTGESINPVRLWSREDVRSSFLPHPNLEALTTEWVQDHARKVEVAHGDKVQVHPKGGWWRRTVGELRTMICSQPAVGTASSEAKQPAGTSENFRFCEVDR